MTCTTYAAIIANDNFPTILEQIQLSRALRRKLKKMKENAV